MFETATARIQDEDTFRCLRPNVKACTCPSGTCSLHEVSIQTDISDTSISTIPSRRHSITSLKKRFENDELKLSLSSLVSDGTEVLEHNARQAAEVYEKWLAEKEERRRHLEQERKMVEQMLIVEQQKKFELERSNFINWLKTKKADEERKRLKEIEEQKKKKELDEDQKQKRQLENRLSYQLWCKRKEQKYLESKLREQIEKVRNEEERKKKQELNQQAYEEWLRNSRYKPRPIPLNRGLESLRSSVSVSYVNPTPWEPNIDSPKPTTQ